MLIRLGHHHLESRGWGYAQGHSRSPLTVSLVAWLYGGTVVISRVPKRRTHVIAIQLSLYQARLPASSMQGSFESPSLISTAIWTAKSLTVPVTRFGNT